MRLITVLVVAAVAGTACERPSERGDRQREFAGRVLEGALAHPRSAVVAIATGEDAAEVTFSTPALLPDVAAWYREALRRHGWEIRNEAQEPDGTLSLYAVQGRRPLWIRLRPSVGGPGTTYSLIGAEVKGDTIR